MSTTGWFPMKQENLTKAFTIDLENNITAFASPKEVDPSREGTERFTSVQELSSLAERWPGARLIEIWNGLPGVVPVQRFTSRQVAATRIWKAIQHLEPATAPRARTVASKQSGGTTRATRVGARLMPESSKTIQVIALLRRPKGATLQAIMRATGWQAHSGRGFVSGQLKKKFGLKVRSFKRDGERVYALKG